MTNDPDFEETVLDRALFAAQEAAGQVVEGELGIGTPVALVFAITSPDVEPNCSAQAATNFAPVGEPSKYGPMWAGLGMQAATAAAQAAGGDVVHLSPEDMANLNRPSMN